MNFLRWKPYINLKIKREHDLLLKYWEEVGGLIFTEVSVLTRRIDGIRFNPSSQQDIVSFSRSEFLKASFAHEDSMVDIIEVKYSLNRGVVGQVIVGAILLEKEYGIALERLRKVVVCRNKNPFLAEACEKLDIKIWTPKPI
jgi:hypothetical protein